MGNGIKYCTSSQSVPLVKNKIPHYVKFLSNYLGVPIELNEAKYITLEEDRENKEQIYIWTKHPYVNTWLASNQELHNGIFFRCPYLYRDSMKH